MKTFPLEPYGFMLHFTASHKEFDKMYAEYDRECPNLSGDNSGICWRNGKHIYIGVFDEGVESVDTLAHEIQHALLDIAVFIQYDPSTQQEPLCYLAGYMMKTLIQAHPKFKEALNEPVGTRAGNGGRRSAAGDGSHQQQRGQGRSAQQPVCTGGVPEVRDSAVGTDPDVPEREEAGSAGKR